MLVSKLFSFPVNVHNEYPNIRIWVHPSPCDQGIILIDVEQLDLEGKPTSARYLKLLPEGTENQVYFGKDRKIENIPGGAVKQIRITSGSDGTNLCLCIEIEYVDGSDFTLPWLTN